MAVAVAGSRVVVQTREPSLLIIGQDAVVLPGTSRMDTGHFLFHAATQAGLACASCHPEGHEDGHVWSFANMGPRRTQSISGGFLGTAPFHWNGEMKDFTTLVHDVMQGRMSGPVLSPGHVEAFGNWIDKIPALRPAPQLDAAASARGKLLFSSTALGCTACHTGPRLTDNINADVGTGGPFQVPSLTGLFWRAPYMHNGCAATLADRFGSCGGTKHGNTSTLSVAALGDLTAYLATL